jgi:DNA-binding response OmpR family regulator
MRMLLTPETRSIDIACSVEDALAQMAEAHFDHIVIEGASAGGAGRSAIEGIRMLVAQARPANAHTSLLAAASEELGAAQMFAAGADQVILKPIGAAELIAQLKKLYEAAEPAAEPSEPPLRQAAG